MVCQIDDSIQCLLHNVIVVFAEVHYKETPKWEQLHKETAEMLCNLISINSSYSSQVIPAKKPGEQAQQLGNKTECGLLGFVLALGQSYQQIRDRNPEETIFKVY